MENLYLKIDGSQYKRIFVVGDLHGCLHQLEQKIWAEQFDTETDLLISVGDLIDRGPDSIGCLRLLNQSWFKAVLGNHEVMALNALASEDDASRSDIDYYNWFRNGGDWITEITVEERSEALELFTKVADLPGIIEVSVDDKTIVICHADYPSNQYEFGKPINTDALIWNRARVIRNQNSQGTVIKGADEFYFGHTPAKDPMHYHNQHYIDTGAVFEGGRLTMVRLK